MTNLLRGTYVLVVPTLCVAAFGCGMLTSWGGSPNEYEKYGFLLFAMLGAWVSAFATFAAVLVALWTAKKQADEARQLALDLARDDRRQDAVRCLHHSMAIVNDLRGRVASLRTNLTEAARPLAVLTLNMATTTRRYDALYDRDIYKHLPGPLIDQISNLSGAFFGVEALVTAIASTYSNELHVLVKIPPDSSGLAATFDKLQNDLEDLFTALELERGKIDLELQSSAQG